MAIGFHGALCFSGLVPTGNERKATGSDGSVMDAGWPFDGLCKRVEGRRVTRRRGAESRSPDQDRRRRRRRQP